MSSGWVTSTRYHMRITHLQELIYSLDCLEWQPRTGLCIWDESTENNECPRCCMDSVMVWQLPRGVGNIHWCVVVTAQRDKSFRILMRISVFLRFSNDPVVGTNRGYQRSMIGAKTVRQSLSFQNFRCTFHRIWHISTASFNISVGTCRLPIYVANIDARMDDPLIFQ